MSPEVDCSVGLVEEVTGEDVTLASTTQTSDRRVRVVL